MRSALNSTLAAKFNLHQEKQLSVADSVTARIDRKLETLWGRIQRVLNSRENITVRRYHLYHLLIQVVMHARNGLEDGLEDMVASSYNDASMVLSKTIPVAYLGLLTERKPVLENKNAQRQQIQNALFDKLDPEKVRTIIRGTTNGMSWEGRLAQQTRRASPDQLASLVTTGFSAGATPAELSRQIRPFVQGISSTARRVARNESMRIAHETRMQAYEQLGDMVIGYQIHATMDARVRPHHAARSGTIYYKKPGPGQLGLDKMPRPPLEEDGTVAHNCRCWLTPVLEVQKHIEEDPAAKAIFTNARDELIPNPAVYTDWFERSPEHDQKRVVGARRMNMLRSLLPNEKITWGHFVDPDTGRLLDEQELYRETPEKRKKRLERFTKLISRRRELTRQVANYGYLPPSNPGINQAIGMPKQSLPGLNTTPNFSKKTPAPSRPPITTQTAEKHFSYTTKESDRFLKITSKGAPPLRRYIGVLHEKINDALRQRKNDPQTRKIILGIDKAMKKLGRVIPEGTVLYRSMPKNAKGKDHGFMSTSLSLDVAKKDFGGKDKYGIPKIIYKITLLKPIKGIYISGLMRLQQGIKLDHTNIREEEILLPRGMKLITNGVQLPDGTWEAFLK